MRKPFIAVALITLIGSTFVLSCSNNEGSTLDKNKTESTASPTEKVPEPKYIKGIVAANFYDPLESKGFTVDKQYGGDAFFVNCTRNTSESMEVLRVAGDGPSQIIEVKATYTSLSGDNPNKQAAQFLGFISSAPYDNSNPEQARKWVEDNIAKNAKTEIGGVSFEIAANVKNMRTLTITVK